MSSYFQKILIVDDDAVDRFILNKMIQRSKIAKEIIEAETGIEALRIISTCYTSGEQLPDLIFLDINMPLMDGFAFLETFDQFHSQFKKRIQIVIICSSRDEKEKQRAFQHESVINYLIKPVSDEELVQLTEKQRLPQAS